MKTPDVSIIICTCNRAVSLRRTLEALGDVAVPNGLSAELLVVDNGSSDNTEEVVRSRALTDIPLRYLLEPRPGQCHARNAGVAAARGEIIVFTDDDVHPSQEWLQAMCAPLLAGRGQAAAGGVRLAPDLERPWMGATHRDWLASTEHERPGAPAARVGANMAFSRSVLARVTSFDTELGPGALGFGDDTLFLNQLETAGYRVCAGGLQSVVVHHCDTERLSRHSFLNSAKNHGRSGAYLAHHWEHRVFPRPHLLLARAYLRLSAWRLRRRGQWASPEGCPEWEMQLVRDVHFNRQYLLERRRDRCYDKLGLVKRAPSSTR